MEKCEQNNIKMRNGRGIRRLIMAGKSSLAGFKATFKHEEAFRQELLLTVVFFPAAFLLGKTGVEKTLLAGSLLLVLIVELLNSAVEAVVDRVGLEFHPLSGRAKDMGSAAVLLVIVHALGVWLCILFLD